MSRLSSAGLATVVSKLLTLASLGVAARALGPESWGLAGSAVAAVAYASVLLSPGLTAWGTREIARDRQHAPAILVIVNLTQAVLACAAYFTVVALGQTLLEGPAARAVLLVSALALFAQAFSVDWAFEGLERADVPARLQASLSAARLAAVVWLCRSPADVLAYAAILPLFLGAHALAGSVLLFREGCLRLLWPGWARLRRGLAAAWPLGAAMALFLLIHNANTLIVQGWHGSRAAGQYLAALRLVEMASVLPGIAGSVLRPRLARLSWTDPAAAARESRLYARAHLLAGWLLAPAVFAEAPRIIAWIYGGQYTEAVPLLRIFSVAMLANYLVCGYTSCLVAFGRDRVLLRSMVIAGVVSIGAGLLLTPWWGAAGAALSASLMHPAGLLAALPEYRRTVGSLDFAAWKLPCAAAAALVALSWLLESHGVSTGWRVGCCFSVYLAIAGRCWMALQQGAVNTMTGGAHACPQS